MQPGFSRLAFIGIVVAPWLAAGRATAELIVYEPFNYAAGTPLVGANQGIGFTSPWASGGWNARLFHLFQVAPGVLDYPGLATEGTTHVSGEPPPDRSGIAGLGRTLASPLGREDGTYYLSFLHRPDGEEDYGSIVLGTGQGNELAIGKSASTGEYYISNRGGVGRVLSGVPGEVGRTRFVVVKMEFRAGPDRFTLYMDPVPGTAEPGDGVVKEDLDLQYAEKIFLYSRASWSVDEIRLGTSWEDVTPAGQGETVNNQTVRNVQRISWKPIILVAAILVAFVIVTVPLVIVGIIAYKRGQKSRGGGS